MTESHFNETVAAIRARSQVKPLVGIILGSGLGSFADKIKVSDEIPYSELPHFNVPSIEGHKGRLYLGHIGTVPVAALQGRLHHYEGYSMEEIVYPTRTLAMLGIEALILTNASGGVNKRMRPGDFMIINDHINLMGDNPLRGKSMEAFGPRFPDMTEAYDKEFVKIAVSVAKAKRIRYHSGVYVGVAGPTYETPAEVKYISKIGGDAVGMSTVPESIAANHFGLRVGGVSCITNMAAGISKGKLSHSDVTVAAKKVEEQFCSFMSAFVTKIGEALEKTHS